MDEKQHPNQMKSPAFPTNKTRAELLAERDILGPIIGGNYLPYVARLVDVEVDGDQGEYRQVVVPATMEELHAYWNRLEDFQVDGREQDTESRVTFARKVAAELWQASWIAGIPAEETIFCAACQQQRPAHGSNWYDDLLLCNACVGQVEVLMARGELSSVPDWVSQQARTNQLRLAIREAERLGQGYIQLKDGRWLEVHPLYQYLRHSEYHKQGGEDDGSWPYPDMRPVMYHCYLRSDWHPGDYFHRPDAEIVFTSDNKLLHFLQTGELPGKPSRSPLLAPEQDDQEA